MSTKARSGRSKVRRLSAVASDMISCFKGARLCWQITVFFYPRSSFSALYSALREHCASTATLWTCGWLWKMWLLQFAWRRHHTQYRRPASVTCLTLQFSNQYRFQPAFKLDKSQTFLALASRIQQYAYACIFVLKSSDYVIIVNSLKVSSVICNAFMSRAFKSVRMSLKLNPALKSWLTTVTKDNVHRPRAIQL